MNKSSERQTIWIFASRLAINKINEKILVPDGLVGGIL